MSVEIQWLIGIGFLFVVTLLILFNFTFIMLFLRYFGQKSPSNAKRIKKHLHTGSGYEKAKKIIEIGGDIADISDKCSISRDEASLLFSLHKKGHLL